MKKLTFRAGSAFVLLAVLAASGCGTNRVKVQGRLERDGKPFAVSPDDQVFLVFTTPVGAGQKESSNAVVNKDGTFTVAGPEGEGIRPGKYAILLRLTPSIYALTAKKANAAEKFNNAFTNERTTPLRCELTTSTTEVIIDVGKKSATGR
jgi:hypothetical protein